MYSQLIHFIIALLLFSLQQPGTQAPRPFLQTLGLACALFAAFVAFCRWAFLPLERGIRAQRSPASLNMFFQRIQGRLSLVVLIVLAIYVFGLDIKYYLQKLPGFERSLTVSGLVGLGIYLLHMSVVWYASYPCHCLLQHATVKRLPFLWGHLRFYLALLIPWVLLSVFSDVVQHLQAHARLPVLTSEYGQIVLMGLMLLAFLLYSPWVVVRLWRCEPLPASEARRELEGFCREQHFAVGGLLTWPIFAGETLTAGIIGVLPRLRYILMTPALLQLLNGEELKAVAAHEMGHVRRHHVPFYLVFFMCYSFLAYALHDLLLMFLLRQDFLFDWATSSRPLDHTLFSVAYSLPIILLMVLYFRYIFGYFMRQCERQADLYALEVIGHPLSLISSLQKIAVHSGHSHDHPSWHHFSIGQRIRFLLACSANPALPSRHHRRLYGAAALFCSVVIALGFAGLQFRHTAVAKSWREDLQLNLLERQVHMEFAPHEIRGAFAGLLLERNHHEEARRLLEQLLEERPEDPQTLNNLAWLYATAPSPHFQPEAALELAQRAVALRRDSAILDTLAEALYVNGRHAEALAAIDEALTEHPNNADYLLSQRRKFLNALEGGEPAGEANP
jgi:Zn-dependent protease with chaperone function